MLIFGHASRRAQTGRPASAGSQWRELSGIVPDHAVYEEIRIPFASSKRPESGKNDELDSSLN